MSLSISVEVSPIWPDLLKLTDPSLIGKATRAVGVYMIAEIQKHFSEQTLWDDSKMPKSRAAELRGGLTLLDKAALKDSYHAESGHDEVTLGSNLIYAAIHHAGGRAGRGHKTLIIPRPILGVSSRNEREIIEEISSILMGV